MLRVAQRDGRHDIADKRKERLAQPTPHVVGIGIRRQNDILGGDFTLVGPRPPFAAHPFKRGHPGVVEELCALSGCGASIPAGERQRLHMPPGGMAQGEGIGRGPAGCTHRAAVQFHDIRPGRRPGLAECAQVPGGPAGMRRLHPSSLDGVTVDVVFSDVREQVIGGCQSRLDQRFAVPFTQPLNQLLRCLTPDGIALAAAAPGGAPTDSLAVDHSDRYARVG